MKKSILLPVISLILLGLFSSSCDSVMEILPSTSTEETPRITPNPLLLTDSEISVEGRLVPTDSLELAFATGGQIEEVYVHQGDNVLKGDILAKLKGSEQIAAQIAAAELELFLAQQSLDQLDEDLDVLVNQSLQAINNARQAVHDLERKVSSLGLTGSQTDIDLAYTQLLFSKEALDKAEERFKPYQNRPETNLTRARLQVDLANAQKDYDDALRKYNALTGTADDFDQNQTLTDYEIAKGQLAIAEREYEKWNAGPDPAAVASAEARITAAEVQLAAAKARMEELELVATIDGTVVESDLIEGKQVSPGIPMIQLVDFSEWFVDTENLTELEVVDVFVGQDVTVVPDSLPDLELSGEVVSISDTFEEKRGEITYTTRIKIQEIDPHLRWGMTVVVTFLEND